MYKLKQIPEDFIVEEIPLFEFKDKGKYTYFLLEKKEYNTERVIQNLSKYYNIPRKKFSYAGNKDKHAITKQYVSVKGKITNKEFTDYSVRVVGYGNEPISLGDLKGNKFTITVRNIDKKPYQVISTINYFDDQRFGKCNLEIGQAILKKDFKKAANLIDLKEVKEHLKQNPNDNIGAIKKTPFKILKLYVHAVQSYLWNELTAEYVKQKTKDYFEVGYKHGQFVFSDSKIINITIPLIAFDTEFENKEIENLYNEILNKNRLSLRDFIIRQIPDITPHGSERDLINEVKNLKISNLEKDDLNKIMKKIKLSFELNKGSYATIVIKNLLFAQQPH